MIMKVFLHFFFILVLTELTKTESKWPRSKSTAHHLVNHLRGRSLCEKYPASRKVGRSTNLKDKLKMYNFVILQTQYENKKTIDGNEKKSVPEEIKRSTFDYDDPIETEQLDKLVQKMAQLLIIDETQQEVDPNSKYEQDSDYQISLNKREINRRKRNPNLQSIESEMKDQINPINDTESELEHPRKKRHRY